MGGVILVCGEGRDKISYSYSLVLTHTNSYLGWSISGPVLTSEVSVILKSMYGKSYVLHMGNTVCTYPVGFSEWKCFSLSSNRQNTYIFR